MRKPSWWKVTVKNDNVREKQLYKFVYILPQIFVQLLLVRLLWDYTFYIGNIIFRIKFANSVSNSE